MKKSHSEQEDIGVEFCELCEEEVETTTLVEIGDKGTIVRVCIGCLFLKAPEIEF